MTDELRNLETRQSLPWIAGRCCQNNSVKGDGKVELTSIRDLSNLVRVEAVPTLTSTSNDELVHISQASDSDVVPYGRNVLSL